MSIHVLQRKSRRFKAPISGRGNKGFSLNGTHRNIGAVGTTNLGKSVTRTPFRGLKPMGNGGCCGRYVVNVSNSGSCCFGARRAGDAATDAAYVKTSVKNTKGLLYSKKYYPTGQQYNYQVPAGTAQCACPTIWVQDTSPLNHSQGIYISEVSSKSAACDLSKNFVTVIRACPVGCKAASYYIGGKKYIRETYAKSAIPKPQPGAGTTGRRLMDQSQYIKSGLMSKNCLPTPPNKQHFPMNVNNHGCFNSWLTPQDAKNAGALPADWMTAPVESTGRGNT
jgi:hypothetical protein